MTTSPKSEPLSREECLALLSTASVGRLGAVIDALPVVLPMNFALHDGAIVFNTMPGTKLHDATIDAVVALLVDNHGSEPASWSVLVQGKTEQITDPSSAVRNLPLGAWAPHGRYVSLKPTVVTGRRFWY